MDIYFMQKALLELDAAYAEAELEEAGDLILGLINMARVTAAEAVDKIFAQVKARKEAMPLPSSN